MHNDNTPAIIFSSVCCSRCYFHCISILHQRIKHWTENMMETRVIEASSIKHYHRHTHTSAILSQLYHLNTYTSSQQSWWSCLFTYTRMPSLRECKNTHTAEYPKNMMLLNFLEQISLWGITSTDFENINNLF